MSAHDETKIEPVLSSVHSTRVEGFGGKPKTFKAYVIGLVLSFALTCIAFMLVQKKMLDGSMLYVSLGALAIVQLIVQSACFLRLNASPEGRWNLFAFLFTLFIIAILVSGSLWIMFSLDHNTTLQV